jgi:hypothetical protein
MRRWATNIPFASLSDPNLHPVLDLDPKVTSNPHPVDLDPKLTSKPIRIRKNRIGSSKNLFAEAISLPTCLGNTYLVACSAPPGSSRQE